MRTLNRLAAATSVVALSAAVGSPLTVAAPATKAGRTVELSLSGTHETGVFDATAAESPAFDKTTGRLFVVNAQRGAVDVLRVGADAVPAAEFALSVAVVSAADGSVVPKDAVVNLVAVAHGIMAVADEAGDKTDLRWLAFYRTDTLAPLGVVCIGALPDSVTRRRCRRTTPWAGSTCSRTSDGTRNETASRVCTPSADARSPSTPPTGSACSTPPG